MNREIKFRAKTIIGEKLVIGHLVYWGGNYQIWETEQDGETHNYQVIPETVGQFTGLKDKNGVDIYEGDIINYGNFTGSGPLVGKPCNHIVHFTEPEFSSKSILEGIVYPLDSDGEIIGNIHTHPELLNNKS